MNAAFGPQDDGSGQPPYVIPPIPICSADSAIVQKILDTNKLKFSVYDIAYADAANRVAEIRVYVFGNDTSLVDTFIIPEEICQLDSLQDLRIEHLLIQHLQIPPIASKRSNVQILMLDQNNLTTIPTNLSFFEQLSNLHLDQNKIDTIASLNINCPNLLWFTLEQNALTTIPKDVNTLSNLKGLYLAMNEINSLPSELFMLDSLSVLTIYQNKLCNVPDSIANKLSNFDFSWKASQNCN